MRRVILLLETSREFGRQLITGITRYSKTNNSWSFYKNPMDLKSSIPHLSSWKPDGIIMRDCMISKELLKLKIPTILAIHNSLYPNYLPVIKTDSEGIAKLASNYLIEKGIKNLAFCGFNTYEWSKEREFYFNKFNYENGLITNNYVPAPSLSQDDWEHEQPILLKWIKKLPKPVGIFACNDDRAQHILELCKIANLKVPEDVAVIGVDNDTILCETSDPPLTSIALNIESSGFEAARLLEELIENKGRAGKQILVTPTQIVERQSTDVSAVNDSNVSFAIQYIKNNATNKILIDDVVKASGVKRRTLENRFRRILHKSIYQEIRQVRVEIITKMLLETNLPISKITSSFNFTDSDHASRFFKKEKGVGLREFRKRHKGKA